MLSIGVLHSSAQAGTYYAQDDYYTKGGAGEPSQWDGQGAASFGLAGPVDRTQAPDQRPALVRIQAGEGDG